MQGLPALHGTQRVAQPLLRFLLRIHGIRELCFLIGPAEQDSDLRVCGEGKLRVKARHAVQEIQFIGAPQDALPSALGTDHPLYAVDIKAEKVREFCLMDPCAQRGDIPCIVDADRLPALRQQRGELLLSIAPFVMVDMPHMPTAGAQCHSHQGGLLEGDLQIDIFSADAHQLGDPLFQHGVREVFQHVAGHDQIHRPVCHGDVHDISHAGLAYISPEDLLFYIHGQNGIVRRDLPVPVAGAGADIQDSLHIRRKRGDQGSGCPVDGRFSLGSLVMGLEIIPRFLLIDLVDGAFSPDLKGLRQRIIPAPLLPKGRERLLGIPTGGKHALAAYFL